MRLLLCIKSFVKQNKIQMFDSISNIFSLPTVRRNKYEAKPSLKQHLHQHRPHKTQSKPSTKQPYFQSLIQCLANPIEQWILHHQNHFKSHILNRTIYEMIVQNSSRGRRKQDEVSRVTVHNLFVLMVQYEVLGEFLKDIVSTQLQLMIDGVCAIYLKNDKDSFEELTCLLHHMVTKSRMHQQDKIKELSIFKPFDIQNAPHFLQLYSSLQSRLKDKFYPTVVKVIPMFSELLKIIVRTNPTANKYVIIQKIPWLSTISLNLLSFISKDTNEITLKQTTSIEFQNVVVQDIENTQLKKKMVDFAKKACKIAGFVSSKELFTYACRELYLFPHVIKLNKRILQLVYDIEQVNLQHQKIIIGFVRMYLQAILNFDINLPDNQIRSLISIFKLSEFTYKDQILEIGLSLDNAALHNFIEAVQKSELYQWQSENNPNAKKQHPQFFFQKQQIIVSYFLRLVFNLQVQYFEVINIILQKINKKFTRKLQYYLIKNGLLHFLVEQQQAILGNDHKMHKVYFKMICNLIKFNPYCYRIFDEILQNSLEKNQRSLFTEQIRKNFYLSQEFLTTALADTLSINAKQKPSKYFLAYGLQLLLYNDQKSKHDIWISYIHDVIIRDLTNTKLKKEKIGKKDETIDRDINEWVTIAIMIQIQYVNFRRGQDLQLGEFTMNYLTNILNQAIKWKYEDQTEVMRRILGNYEQWQLYYTEAILSSENNEDVLQTNLGTTVNFLFLKRWNRKICNSIKLFIESVLTTEILNDGLLF